MQVGKHNGGVEVIRRRVRVGISMGDKTAPPQESSDETDLRFHSETPIRKTMKFIAVRWLNEL
jgi:hypothetical protein